MEKENNTDESDFSKNETPDLSSLKSSEFEPKQTSEILTVVRSSHQRCSQKFRKINRKTPMPESLF